MTVVVQSPAATAIVLPRFYFPHWVVRDVSGQLLPVKATNPGRLVAFAAPAGRSTFRLSPGRAPFELLGAFASLDRAAVARRSGREKDKEKLTTCR